MKILLYIASRGWGGAEKIFVELANHLALECDTHVLLLKGTIYADRFDPAVKVSFTQIHGSRRNPFLLYSLYNAVQRIHPDIVHTHAAKATETFHLVNRLLKLRHIATKHNTRKGKIFNRVNNVTAVSEQVKKTIHNHGTVNVIYNGISPVEIKDQEKQEPFSIISVGRLDAYKGFDRLIREVKKLPFDYTLNIVGEGPERSALEKQIRDLQLDRKVFLRGHREDIPELLSRSHVQVISSRNEGFSLVAVEGLFYSDVLISSRVGIADEILPKILLYENFDIAAKIKETHSDYEKFAAAFKNVKEMHAQRFLMTEASRNYLELYRGVLQ